MILRCCYLNCQTLIFYSSLFLYGDGYRQYVYALKYLFGSDRKRETENGKSERIKKDESSFHFFYCSICSGQTMEHFQLTSTLEGHKSEIWYIDLAPHPHYSEGMPLGVQFVRKSLPVAATKPSEYGDASMGPGSCTPLSLASTRRRFAVSNTLLMVSISFFSSRGHQNASMRPFSF